MDFNFDEIEDLRRAIKKQLVAEKNKETKKNLLRIYKKLKIQRELIIYKEKLEEESEEEESDEE